MSSATHTVSGSEAGPGSSALEPGDPHVGCGRTSHQQSLRCHSWGHRTTMTITLTTPALPCTMAPAREHTRSSAFPRCPLSPVTPKKTPLSRNGVLSAFQCEEAALALAEFTMRSFSLRSVGQTSPGHPLGHKAGRWPVWPTGPMGSPGAGAALPDSRAPRLLHPLPAGPPPPPAQGDTPAPQGEAGGRREAGEGSAGNHSQSEMWNQSQLSYFSAARLSQPTRALGGGFLVLKWD